MMLRNGDGGGGALGTGYAAGGNGIGSSGGLGSSGIGVTGSAAVVGGSGGLGGSGSSNSQSSSKPKDRVAGGFANHGASEKPGPEVQDIRIVVLGAGKVGKTSLVQQFVHCTCPEFYTQTRSPTVYHPSITVNEHCYDARIVDCPTLRYFPTDSLQEFSDFRGYGLRSASGYVLVYDLTDEASFAYIRRIRECIQEQGIDAPILVAANKADLVSNGRAEKDSKDAAKDKGKEARRETSNVVRKQWKCMYVECSAKYNWHVGNAFRELLKAIDHKDFGHKPTSARVQEALRRNQCCVM